jgi:hypothetical protein
MIISPKREREVLKLWFGTGGAHGEYGFYWQFVREPNSSQPVPFILLKQG